MADNKTSTNKPGSIEKGPSLSVSIPNQNHSELSLRPLRSLEPSLQGLAPIENKIAPKKENDDKSLSSPLKLKMNKQMDEQKKNEQKAYTFLDKLKHFYHEMKHLPKMIRNNLQERLEKQEQPRIQLEKSMDPMSAKPTPRTNNLRPMPRPTPIQALQQNTRLQNRAQQRPSIQPLRPNSPSPKMGPMTMSCSPNPKTLAQEKVKKDKNYANSYDLKMKKKQQQLNHTLPRPKLI